MSVLKSFIVFPFIELSALMSHFGDHLASSESSDFAASGVTLCARLMSSFSREIAVANSKQKKKKSKRTLFLVSL